MKYLCFSNDDVFTFENFKNFKTLIYVKLNDQLMKKIFGRDNIKWRTKSKVSFKLGLLFIISVMKF